MGYGVNRWIPPDHLTQIMAQLQPENRAIAQLAELTGYRIDDIIRSRRGDWKGRKIKLKEAKTGKTREVRNSPEIRAAAAALDRCAASRRHAGAMCPGRRQRRGDSPFLARSTIWRAWRRACAAAGLAGRGYTVHSLRRCYAVGVWQRTRSIEAVQRDLGHDKPSTTWIYLQDALEAALRAVK